MTHIHQTQALPSFRIRRLSETEIEAIVIKAGGNGRTLMLTGEL
jgi:hypothetical protein